MSGKNHYRAAAACSRVTGTSFGRCVEWERRGLLSLRQPVPDAEADDQRTLEAMMIDVLADTFKDRQLGADRHRYLWLEDEMVSATCASP